MQWGPQQATALKYVDRWFYQESKRQQVCRVFGFAGTGKTTLAVHFAESVDGIVCFGSFTGKAADVMRKKGCIGATTIHTMIYNTIVEKDGTVRFTLNRDSIVKDASLIVIDECSMVNTEIGEDLKSFGVPILVLGDPAQLPPVDGAGYFTNAEPDIMLTEIHRQAKDNPIIYLSTLIREKTYPEYGDYGDSRIISKIKTSDLTDADQVLVGRHVTRHMVNSKIRKIKNYEGDYPNPGERLICHRNDSSLQIFNGGMFEVVKEIPMKYQSKFIQLFLDHDDEDRQGFIAKIHRSHFSDEVPAPGKNEWKMLKGSQEFNYGYGITTHKAQGSQWNDCLVWDESYCFRDEWWRWLYTAVTRSAEKTTIYRS